MSPFTSVAPAPPAPDAERAAMASATSESARHVICRAESAVLVHEERKTRTRGRRDQKTRCITGRNPMVCPHGRRKTKQTRWGTCGLGGEQVHDVALCQCVAVGPGWRRRGQVSPCGGLAAGQSVSVLQGWSEDGLVSVGMWHGFPCAVQHGNAIRDAGLGADCATVSNCEKLVSNNLFVREQATPIERHGSWGAARARMAPAAWPATSRTSIATRWPSARGE